MKKKPHKPLGPNGFSAYPSSLEHLPSAFHAILREVLNYRLMLSRASEDRRKEECSDRISDASRARSHAKEAFVPTDPIVTEKTTIQSISATQACAPPLIGGGETIGRNSRVLCPSVEKMKNLPPKSTRWEIRYSLNVCKNGQGWSVPLSRLAPHSQFHAPNALSIAWATLSVSRCRLSSTRWA